MFVWISWIMNINISKCEKDINNLIFSLENGKSCIEKNWYKRNNVYKMYLKVDSILLISSIIKEKKIINNHNHSMSHKY